MMFRRKYIQETFLREINQEFELENEDHISYRKCWIYRLELGATLVERSSSLLTLGRVEASFALLSLKRSL